MNYDDWRTNPDHDADRAAQRKERRERREERDREDDAYWREVDP